MRPTSTRKLDDRTETFTLLLGMPASRAEHSGPHLHSTHLRHLRDTFVRRDGLCTRATADFRKSSRKKSQKSRKIPGFRTWGCENRFGKKHKISKISSRKKSQKSRKFPGFRTWGCENRFQSLKCQNPSLGFEPGGGKNPGRPAGWAAANPARTHARARARTEMSKIGAF